MRLQDFLVTDAMVPDLKGESADEAIGELLDSLIAAGTVPGELRDELLSLILERERNGSTGFGKGVAVPHVKHPSLPGMAGAIGISQRGLDFNALDRQPVYSVVLLISPKDQPDEHLQAMENIFSNLQNATFRRFLRQANTAAEIQELIQDADAQQLPQS
jgi:PTS system fructose-specific IIA component/PTS system nitrogen regulatory IIA component